MSAIRISHAATFLVAVAMVLLVVGVSRFVQSDTGEPEAGQSWSEGPVDDAVFPPRVVAFQEHAESPPAGRSDESPRAHPPRKQRSPSPPMKDLRLRDEKESAEERIDEALSKPTEVDFHEQALADVLSFLKEQHGINIWLDHKAMADAGIDLEHRVTLQMAGARLESVLNLLLDPLRLEWLIQDEVLKITTRERAQELAETQAFDVLNLVDAGHVPDELILAIINCVEPSSWIHSGGKGTIGHSGGVLICRQSQRVLSSVAILLRDLDELADEQLDRSPTGGGAVATLKVYRTGDYPANDLARVLSDLIAPETWGVKGTSVRAIDGALFVKQTPHVHRQIEMMLKQLLVPTDAPVGDDGAVEMNPAAAGRPNVEARHNGPSIFRIARKVSQRRIR